MAKRASLSSLKHEKPSANTAKVTSAADGKVAQKGQTLRLSVPAWQQLKRLAVDEAKSSHELLIEAVNLLFQKHGKPPIA